MITRTKLKDGKSYTVKDLFQGDNDKIVIPDLQRDYCWTPDMVTGLLNTFIEFSRHMDESNDTKIPMGLIYGYYSASNDGQTEATHPHLQLCDGQQRLTSIFLILGMLNRKLHKSNNEKSYTRLLMSDFEKEQDDCEPYLLYAIRESSTYFLSDLTLEFFIGDKIENVDELTSQSWYLNDYKNDPTVNNIIEAIRAIEKILTQESLDLDRLGTFITERMDFLFCDMGNRTNGEETFVVINTTGEPLSGSENLKPMVIRSFINSKNREACKQWEEIETWFWKNRNNGNDTADAGFVEFLRWITALTLCNKNSEVALSLIKKDYFKLGIIKRSVDSEDDRFYFPYDEISIDCLYKYYKIIVNLFDNHERFGLDKAWLSPKPRQEGGTLLYGAINQIDLFRVLALLAYCSKWKITDYDDQNLVRFSRFINNIIKVANVARIPGDLTPEIVYIAKKCRDIVDMLQLNDNDSEGKRISKTILSEEVELILNILKEYKNRAAIEDEFERTFSYDTPCHKIWRGEILPLLHWSCTSYNSQGCEDIDSESKILPEDFSLDEFIRYRNTFDAVFHGECGIEIDNVRRALISYLPYYPICLTRNYTFGWAWEDWHSIIFDKRNILKFRDFLNAVSLGIGHEYGNNTKIKTTVRDIMNSLPTNHDYSEFVFDKYLLDYCNQKHINFDANRGWMLCVNKEAQPFAVADAHYLAHIHYSNPEADNLWNHSSYDNGITFMNQSEWKFYARQGPGFDKDRCPVLSNGSITLDIMLYPFVKPDAYTAIFVYDVKDDKNLKNIDLAASICSGYAKTLQREGHKIILPTIEHDQIDNFLKHCILFIDANMKYSNSL
ncbi:MAG: DUF262 domain-containing protein [Bacteroides sp.]|nr:DUF262 domain-containing protein [Bacteroides sp.]